MITTPLGDLELYIDGRLSPYQEAPEPVSGVLSGLTGRFSIAVSLTPDGNPHTIACRINGHTPSPSDEGEGGENLECKSFYKGDTKLTLGMEGDMCFVNGKRLSHYDYDNELLPDGVQYMILPATKTENYRFGVAWLTGYNESSAIHTWLGADPGCMGPL